MGTDEKIKTALELLREKLPEIIFREGYSDEMLYAGETRPVVAIWDDRLSENDGGSILAAEMYLNGMAYGEGLRSLETVFAVLEQVFPMIKDIKRESPRTDGDRVVLRCEALVGNTEGKIYVKTAEERCEYREIFSDSPLIYSGGSRYEIYLKDIFSTEEELENMKEIRYGGYSYRDISIRKTEESGGRIISAELVSLRRDKL